MILNPTYYQKVLANRKDIRRQTMRPDVAEAFFGTEEMYDQFAIERFSIQQNNELTEAQRKTRLSTLYDKYPYAITKPHENMADRETLADQISAIRKSGGSEEDVHAVRTQNLGEDAATRLAELDKKRKIWQQRLTNYQNLRQAIRASEELSIQEKVEKIEELRHSLFTERELLRVDAVAP